VALAGLTRQIHQLGREDKTMKLLLENWRRYQRMEDRISYLESGKRFVLDELVEVTEEDNNPRLSEQELNKIKKWAGLSGQPSFLGRGTMGSAYRFGDKVLKITSDTREAKAAAAIVGKDHPNVYTILAVGRRDPRDVAESPVNKHFVVIYEFIEHYVTNPSMLSATKQMVAKTHRDKGQSIYYNWNPAHLSRMRELVEDLIQRAGKNPDILGPPKEGYGSMRPKVETIANNLGWTSEDLEVFMVFWNLDYPSGGSPRRSLDTPENIIEFVDSSDLLNSPIARHFHELALGLTFLQQNGITFADLKTSNVMDKNGQIAIIDIGKSAVKGSPELPMVG